MRYHYRCRKRINGVDCGTRFVLPKMIEFYSKPKGCPTCGNTNVSLDSYRMKKEANGHGDKCNCDGYHFPHRRGSKWCNYFKGNRTDEDYQDFYYNVPGSGK